MRKQPKDMVDQIRELFNISSDAGDSLRRKEAFALFEASGIPTRKEEEYKYTDLQRLIGKFDLGSARPVAEPSIPQVFPTITGNRLVFVDGKFDSSRSDILDSNLEVHPLSSDHPEIAAHLGQYAKPGMDPMLALNTAMATDGVFIKLPANTKLTHPVVIHHHLTGSAGPLTNSRILAVAAKGSEAFLIETQTSEAEYLLNSVAEVVVPENAHLQWVKIQNDSETSNIIDHHHVHQVSDCTSTLTTLSLNGGVIRNNVNISVDGENSEAHLYGLYLLDGNSHVDNHTSVDHLKPHSMSNELYKGILDDKAHGVFNGKVYVRQDAQKTNAFQSNKNILISDSAVINTKPQLEIWADDVKCSHGCTTGQLDREALFYLRTRGLSKKSARALLLHAFALEAIEHLHDSPVGALAEELVAAKLNFHKI